MKQVLKEIEHIEKNRRAYLINMILENFLYYWKNFLRWKTLLGYEERARIPHQLGLITDTENCEITDIINVFRIFIPKVPMKYNFQTCPFYL